jgi:hypothetical protein
MIPDAMRGSSGIREQKSCSFSDFVRTSARDLRHGLISFKTSKCPCSFVFGI